MRQVQFPIKHLLPHHQLVNHTSRTRPITVLQALKNTSFTAPTRTKGNILRLPFRLLWSIRAKQLLSRLINNPSKDMETTHQRLQDLITRALIILKAQLSHHTGMSSKHTAVNSLMYLSHIFHHLPARIVACMLLPTPTMLTPYQTIVLQSDALIIITTASSSKMRPKAWERQCAATLRKANSI